MKILNLLPLSLLLGNCMIFDVRLMNPADESTVEKVTVPQKMRMSGFAKEEDLTLLCEGRRLVRVRFVLNAPKEVWCEGKQ